MGLWPRQAAAIVRPVRFEPVARCRPITLVRPSRFSPGALPQVAPYATVLCETTAPATLRLTSGPVAVEGVVDGHASLRVSVGGRTSVHRPRRHRAKGPYDAVALTLTGTHATVLTRTAGEWTGRARVDLADLGVDTREPGFLGGLHVDADAPLVAGPFGQLGLRDLRVVTQADGTPYTRRAGELLLTATSAGPGFFDTAHTSVWALDLDELDHRGRHDHRGQHGRHDRVELTHLGSLFFRRDGRVYGDHATHLVRVDDAWLVATSTWGDFDGTGVGVTLARSTEDLLAGTHVLDAQPLHLPTDGPSAGVWDPHLVRVSTSPTKDADVWLVGYVSATRVSPRFRFHPVVATGPSLDLLDLRAARPDRRATEGTTMVRLGGEWRVLASDGRENTRAVRARFPVFDLDLEEVGTLDADYLTNLPWPTVVSLPRQARDEAGSASDGSAGTLMITFDGTPSGGELLGYGTHGDVVVLRATQSSSGA